MLPRMAMCRKAEDDFEVLAIANKMTEWGAEVFSITDAGHDRRGRFIVWARVDSIEQMNEIDQALAEEEPTGD